MPIRKKDVWVLSSTLFLVILFILVALILNVVIVLAIIKAILLVF